MQLSKILLPVDFSMRNEGSAHYARTLACRFHSQLTIAHVFELRDLIVGGPEAGAAPGFEERRDEARRILEDFHVDDFRNLPVRRILLEGDPAGAIVEFAHGDGTNLIVMPTHGYGPFRRFILGSVTAKVLHDADCPVLTGVHLEELPALSPVLFRRVVCAVDFDAAGEKALRWASVFAAEFQAPLILVHALPSLDGGEARYFDQALPMVLQEAAQERAEQLLKETGISAEFVMENGPVAQVVHDAAVLHKADLVVIGRHVDSGIIGRLRANAYAIIRHSPCPVVSV